MNCWKRWSSRAFLAASLVLSWSLGAMAQPNTVPARVTQAVDVANLTPLPGNVHPLARAQYDHGLAPDSLPMERMMLVLKRSPEQEAALRKLLDEQQIKSSSEYHKWLTPAQFGQRFGPADSDIQAVTDWLGSQGFQDVHVGPGRVVIEFSGTAGLVRDALHAEIHKYVVGGKAYWANATNPEIPSALSPVVAGIVSLNNFPRKPMSTRLGPFQRSKATGEVRPLFTFTQGIGTYYALGPADFAKIYNLPSNLDGTGQSIAIVSDSNINLQDIANFRSMFGLPAKVPNIILNGPDPGITTDEGEADVDVEWAGAVATNATIDLVVSENTEAVSGIDLSAYYIVENNLAPILSVSYGACELALGTSSNLFYSSLWAQAAAQGITVIVAAGDSGSAGCDDLPGEYAAVFGLAVNGLASPPFNVAVGGTDFNDASDPSQYWNLTNASPSQSSAKSYIPEMLWNDSCAAAGSTTGCTTLSSFGLDLIAGGGGPSNCAESLGGVCIYAYAKPAWQTGSGNPFDPYRDTPDVSLFAGDGANGSFYVYCQMDANGGAGGSTTSCDLSAPYLNFQGAGGTSLSAQAFAGIMALVDQQTTSRQGIANYVLYRLAAQSGASCASNTSAVTNSSCIFYDTVTGNNSVACYGGSPDCSNTSGRGYGIMVTNAGTASPTVAWNTTAGYDPASGLGSVNVSNLVANWSSVSFAPTSTTLSLSPISITHGQQVNVTIHVTSSSGTPTGDVSLLGGPNNGNLSIAGFTLIGGTVNGATNALPGGTYGVTAHYAGDGTFGASDSNSVQVTVAKEGSQTFVSVPTLDPQTGVETNTNASSVPYGSTYFLRADVANSSGTLCTQVAIACPTGQVTLTDNSQPIDQGTYTLNSFGYLEDQTVQFAVGVHSVVAAYAGDNSYTASTSSADAITITQAATSTALSASATNQQSAPVTLTALVNTQSVGAAPTGTVQFLIGGIPISGTVTYTPMPYSSSIGTFSALEATLVTTFSTSTTVTAKYSGDVNYTGSTSSAVTVAETPDFSLSADPTYNTGSAGNSATYTISVSGSFGFTSAVDLTCSVTTQFQASAANFPTCSLNPATVTPGQSAVMSTLTVGTIAHSLVPPATSSRPGLLFLPLAGFVALLWLLGCWTYWRRLGRNRRIAWSAVTFFVLFGCLAIMSCGGGGSSTNSGGGTTATGTPAGTYTVRVTGKSGSLSHSTNVQLRVL